jgi:1-acyl-sn-glycerol-3-phosphate acyltransferase
MGGVDRIRDIVVTLVCWLYFTLGFLLFFSPFYVAAALFSSQPECAFQRYNRIFYRGFFAVLRRIAPRQRWDFDVRIAEIRSSVIVCNHRSYLDPLVLIALLNRSKTAVKPVFFTVPLFGWVIRTAGYFPAGATGKWAGLMLQQMENMERYLADGGNLFIFPEGTRSRDGGIGTFSQGALKIARQCRAPVVVLCLRNTDKLFPPGKFFFSTATGHVISAHIVDQIPPDAQQLSLSHLNARVQQGLQSCGQESLRGNAMATNRGH